MVVSRSTKPLNLFLFELLVGFIFLGAGGGGWDLEEIWKDPTDTQKTACNNINLCTWQFCERDLFGMVSSRDPFKGCW